jgi:hypothetical protein
MLGAFTIVAWLVGALANEGEHHGSYNNKPIWKKPIIFGKNQFHNLFAGAFIIFGLIVIFGLIF